MNHSSYITGCRILFRGVLLLAVVAGMIACRSKKSEPQRDYTPKPDAYFRIDPYPAEYHRVALGDSLDSLSFEVPTHSEIALVQDRPLDDVQWLNVRFPRYRATIHCSYFSLRGNFEQLNEESRELVYRQSIRPDWVRAVAYADTIKHIYATFYDLSAESATPLQFVATDSARYLLRGALYLDAPARSDSIAPVIDDLSNHIFHLIESIEKPLP